MVAERREQVENQNLHGFKGSHDERRGAREAETTGCLCRTAQARGSGENISLPDSLGVQCYKVVK